MSVFEFTDYRLFLKNSFSRLPNRGRGKSLELAQAIGAHPTVVSQVLAGKRDFTEEQSLEACEFLGLTPIESKFFRLLVRLARAGTPKLRKAIQGELRECRDSANLLSQRVNAEKNLTSEERSVFYSSWLYSAARLFCSTEKNGRSVEEIMKRFGISRQKATQVTGFLLQCGLVVEKSGKLQMGPQSTFVEQGSPHLPKHHINWRLKSIQQVEDLSHEELMFTGPFSVSRQDFSLLREKITAFIQEFSQIVKRSPAEEVACFNVDFFRLK